MLLCLKMLKYLVNVDIDEFNLETFHRTTTQRFVTDVHLKVEAKVFRTFKIEKRKLFFFPLRFDHKTDEIEIGFVRTRIRFNMNKVFNRKNKVFNRR